MKFLFTKGSSTFDVSFAESEADLLPIGALVEKWTNVMGYTVSVDSIVDDLKRMLAIGVVISVLKDGEVRGVMTGNVIYHYWIDAKCAHEHYLFVDPAFQKQGIGHVLQDVFSGWAKGIGCKHVFIYPNGFGSADPKKIADHLMRHGYNLHGFQLRRDL